MDKNQNKKEEKKMKSHVTEKYPGLKGDLEQIRKSFETLNVKNGVIQLDPKNPKHREWFEDDEDYDV